MTLQCVRVYLTALCFLCGVAFSQKPQAEEGWRWRTTLTNPLILLLQLTPQGPKHQHTFNFHTIHTTMATEVQSARSAVTSSLPVSSHPGNLAVARVSLLAVDPKFPTKLFVADLPITANLGGQASVLPCIFHSMGAKGALLVAYKIIGLGDIVLGMPNGFPAKLLDLFRKEVPYFGQALKPFLGWKGQHDRLTIVSAVAPPSSAPQSQGIGMDLIPGASFKPFGKSQLQTYGHSEQWVMLFFLTYFDNIMIEAMKTLQALPGGSQLTEKDIRVIVLHIHTEADCCRVCAETLALLSLWLGKQGIAVTNSQTAQSLQAQINNRETRFLVLVSGDKAHGSTKNPNRSRKQRGFDPQLTHTSPVKIAIDSPPVSQPEQVFSPYNFHMILAGSPLSVTPTSTLLPPILN